MAPTVRAVGTTASGTGATLSVPVPAGTAAGDLLVILGEENTTPGMTATGWDVLRDTFATDTNLTLLGKLAGAGEPSATVNTNVNHNSARMIGIQTGTHGVTTVATDVVVGTSNTGTVATGTALGITVTADSLVLICAVTTNDAASTTFYSAFTNANLASITEHMDNTIATGSGGGFGMASGSCAGTTTGNSTYTNAAAVTWIAVHLGIKPAGGGPADYPMFTMPDESIYPGPSTV